MRSERRLPEPEVRQCDGLMSDEHIGEKIDEIRVLFLRFLPAPVFTIELFSINSFSINTA